MIEIIEKNFKHTDCEELNAKLDTLISDLSFHREGLTENFMDIILDHSNQKEKEYWLESILIKTQKDLLEGVIDKLEDIVYTEKPKRQPNMDANQSREWLIDEVKPLILTGITSQTEIAKIVGVDPRNGVMTVRVKRAYGCNWKQYVDGVLQGRY